MLPPCVSPFFFLWFISLIFYSINRICQNLLVYFNAYFYCCQLFSKINLHICEYWPFLFFPDVFASSFYLRLLSRRNKKIKALKAFYFKTFYISVYSGLFYLSSPCSSGSDKSSLPEAGSLPSLSSESLSI